MPKNKKDKPIPIPGPFPVYIFKRGKTWWIYYSKNRKVVRESLKTKDEALARKQAKRLSIDLASGDINKKSNDVAFEPLLEKYLEYYEIKNKASSLDTATHFFKMVQEHYHVENISEITMASFEDYMIKRIKSGASVGTVNNGLVYYKSFLNWAEDRDLIEFNPIRKIKKFAGEKTKESRYLSEYEIEAIIKASSKYHGGIWRVYVNTGLRKSELINLKKSDIKDGMILIRKENSKNSTPRIIPISSKIKPFISKCLNQHPEFKHLFVNKDKPFTGHSIRWYFMQAAKKAGIKDLHKVHIQSLRVTFGTNLDSTGASLKSTMALMGHKTPDVTVTNYLKVKTDDLKASIQALNKSPKTKRKKT